MANEQPPASFFAALDKFSIRQGVGMSVLLDKMIRGQLEIRPQLKGKSKEAMVRLLQQEYYIMTNKSLSVKERMDLRNKLYGDKK